LNKAYKFDPSVTTDGLLPDPLRWRPFLSGPMVVCQTCSPFIENPRTESSPSTGLVRKIEFSQTIGVEHPFSGRGDFHKQSSCSDLIQLDNLLHSTAPEASAPRQAGQFSAYTNPKDKKK